MDKDSNIDFNKVFPDDDEGDVQPDTMDSRLIAKSEPVKSATDLLPYHLKRGGYMPYVRDYVDPLFGEDSDVYNPSPVKGATDFLFDDLRRKGYMPYDAEVVGVCISKLIQSDITPAEKEACVEELLLRNQGLVRTIASRYQRPGTDLADLMSLGSLGLRRGIQKFDASKSNNPVATFTDYVSGWVYSSISRSFPSHGNIRYPAHAWSKLAKCFRVYHQGENEGRGKGEEALMAAAGLSLAQLISLWHNNISLDAPALYFPDIARVATSCDTNDDDPDSGWYDTSRPNVPGFDHWCLDDQLSPDVDRERYVHARSITTLRYESHMTLSDVLSHHHRMPHRNKSDRKQRKEALDFQISKRSEAFPPASESGDSPSDILMYEEQNEMMTILAESIKTGEPYIFGGKTWSCPIPQERTRDVLCRRWGLLSPDGKTETLEDIGSSGIIDDDAGIGKSRKIVTRERVRQIQNAGILRLRSRMISMTKEQHRADASMVRKNLSKNGDFGQDIFPENDPDALPEPISISFGEYSRVCHSIAQELGLSNMLKNNQRVSDYDFLKICVAKILFQLTLEDAVIDGGHDYGQKFPGRAHLWSVRGYIGAIVSALQKRYGTKALKWKAYKKVPLFVLVPGDQISEKPDQEKSIPE